MTSQFAIRSGRSDERSTIFSVDDDASRRYATGGLVLDHLHPRHPFVLAEHARWAGCLESGHVFIAEDATQRAIGFAALRTLDAEPYLEQLSVRMDDAGRGVGTALLETAFRWADARGPGLWLNTYGHLSWNRPFYERRGFLLVPEAEWRPEMRTVVQEQRANLPLPDQRVVMFRPRR